jgi:3-hydroxy-9,10-secoandrosta-1,3,5(10)-triene-9,17-dione monooxygenase reductase component
MGNQSVLSPEQLFRSVLGLFASGVTAVTALGPDGGPFGLTVSSFVSVSLDPPLISFCAGHASTTWPLLRTRGSLCVNILGERQQPIAAQLASGRSDKFHAIEWSPSPGGLPVLSGALAWLECTVHAEHPAGDHDIVVCRVLRLAQASEDGPLVRFRGSYARLKYSI